MSDEDAFNVALNALSTSSTDDASDWARKPAIDLGSLLQSLTERQRRLVEMVVMNGWRVRDAAAECGMRLDSLPRQLRKAVDKLRKQCGVELGSVPDSWLTRQPRRLGRLPADASRVADSLPAAVPAKPAAGRTASANTIAPAVRERSGHSLRVGGRPSTGRSVAAGGMTAPDSSTHFAAGER